MKVLITGGAGYVGYSLVEALEQQNEVSEIILYDNISHHDINFFFYGKRLQKVRFIKADLLNNYELNKRVHDVDVVYHLAAEVRSPYSHDDHSKYEQVNQYGTLNLYQSLKNSEVKKVVYLSSAAVYGFTKIPNEVVIPQPENAYGRSKWEGEKYLQNLQNIDLFVIRSANVFGPNPCIRKDAVINKMMLDSLMYERIMISGSGDQLRPFIHIDHLVELMIASIFGKISPGIYNAVQDNCTMNYIRDILIQEMPELEFTYVSANSHFQSMEMKSDKWQISQDLEQDVQKSYRFLKHAFRW